MSSKQWTEARALVENKLLKKRLEAAERENHELKHSLYQLSIRLTSALAEGSRTSHARTDGGTQDLDGSFKGDKILAAAAAAHVDGTDHVTIPESERDLSGSSRSLLRAAEKTRGSVAEKAADANADGRSFGCQLDLSGHTGAVYAVRFAPSGRLLASGSFDRSVRCWSGDEEALNLSGHTHGVTDVAWAPDSLCLCSSGFDHSVRLWDGSRGAACGVWEDEASAFILCVDFANTNTMVAGTSAGQLLLIDRRLAEKPIAINNSSMVNTVVCTSEATVLTGDKRGELKLWDLRSPGRCAGHCVAAAVVGEPQRPISHAAISPPIGSEAVRPRVLSVNSYDDSLRIFTGGALAFADTASATQEEPKFVSTRTDSMVSAASYAEASARSDLTREVDANAISNATTANACSAPCASTATFSASGSTGTSLSATADVADTATAPASAASRHELDADADASFSHGSAYESMLLDIRKLHTLHGLKCRSLPIRSSFFIGDSYLSGGRRTFLADAAEVVSEDESHSPSSVHEAMLVASGSADGRAYLFDVSGPPGTGELVQRLEGHTDRVYATAFHPQQPLLATCSADFTVKVWAANSTRRLRWGAKGGLDRE